MASADRSMDAKVVSITVPRWWRVPVAFVAGAALSAVSLLQFVPGSLISNLPGGGVFGLGEAGEEGDLFVGEEGEYYVDEEGQLRRREVTETIGGAAGSGGTAGRAGGTSGGGQLIGGGDGPDDPKPGGGGPIECRTGRNGGRTDIGVSANTINLATTAVLDGEAASLLKDSVDGMRVVMNKVNAKGGVCGRRLNLQVVNDNFRADLGHQYIKNFLDDKANIFALPVVPSAEGLSSAIQSQDIARTGMPVVGTDGMRVEQYQEPWVWPVAVATVSTMRIMAEYGYKQKGARTFAIVWDNKYRFGVEGRNAFIEQVQKLGGTLVHDQPLDPDSKNYGSEVQAFNQRCSGGKCDMVALLLLPDPAEIWLAPGPAPARLYTSGAQTLFTDRFGERCVTQAGERCHGLAVWTGYNPPIGALRSRPGVAQYEKDVTGPHPNIDIRNQFLQGAYLGMSVFVGALERTGPLLTREALRAELDKMDYQTDLTSTLSWRPGNHWANVEAQSFSMVVTQGTFNGWTRDSGFVRDPAR